uniref:Uncharacterized protein n=1 Tax=Candidatus Berkiella cookevillensis TaxID=437022 RepID=A0A0Q9YB73_9GAMM
MRETDSILALPSHYQGYVKLSNAFLLRMDKIDHVGADRCVLTDRHRDRPLRMNCTLRGSAATNC